MYYIFNLNILFLQYRAQGNFITSFFDRNQTTECNNTDTHYNIYKYL